MVSNLREFPPTSSDRAAEGEGSASGGAAAKSLSTLEREWKIRIHDRLLKVIDLTLLSAMEEAMAREQIRETGRRLLEEESAPLNVEQRRRVLKNIEDEVTVPRHGHCLANPFIVKNRSGKEAKVAGRAGEAGRLV